MNNKIKKAFTLVELLVVIAIIGILSGLIIVGMSSSTNSARIAKAQVFSAALRNSLLMDIISEWKLDGNANDSWSSNNCTWSGSGGSNTTANWRPASECVYGQCLNFDGTDDNLGCGGATTFNLYPIAISVWVKTSATTGTSAGVVNKYVSSSSNGWQIFMLNGRVKAWYFRSVGNSTMQDGDANDGGVINDNNWHNVVYSVDANGGKIYVDGNLKNSRVWTGTAGVATTVQAVTIGHYDIYYSGLIDDIRIYDIAIPVSQIKEHYYTGINKLLADNKISKTEFESKIGELWSFDKTASLNKINVAVKNVE